MRDVLVVEDDRVVLRAVAGLCRTEGLEVDEASSAEAAAARLRDSRYRLAVVDLMLPEESGFELLRRQGTAHRAPLMVMISGYATVDNALRSFRLGAFDFIPKPFDVAELLGVVRRCLRYAERPAEGVADAGSQRQRLLLGRHSWAAMGADGTATVGVGESFPGLLGDVSRVELPAVGVHVEQGQEVARLQGAEEVHRVWSPLSGLVVAVNDRLAAEIELIDRSPLDGGWLARLVAADLDKERQVLTPCGVAGRPLNGGGRSWYR